VTLQHHTTPTNQPTPTTQPHPNHTHHQRQGERLQRPPGCPDSLWRLIESCWAEEPQERPPFTVILEALQAEIAQLDGPSSDGAVRGAAVSGRDCGGQQPSGAVGAAASEPPGVVVAAGAAKRWDDQRQRAISRASGAASAGCGGVTEDSGGDAPAAKQQPSKAANRRVVSRVAHVEAECGSSVGSGGSGGREWRVVGGV